MSGHHSICQGLEWNKKQKEFVPPVCSLDLGDQSTEFGQEFTPLAPLVLMSLNSDWYYTTTFLGLLGLICLSVCLSWVCLSTYLSVYLLLPLSLENLN